MKNGLIIIISKFSSSRMPIWTYNHADLTNLLHTTSPSTFQRRNQQMSTKVQLKPFAKFVVMKQISQGSFSNHVCEFSKSNKFPHQNVFFDSATCHFIQVQENVCTWIQESPINGIKFWDLRIIKLLDFAQTYFSIMQIIQDNKNKVMISQICVCLNLQWILSHFMQKKSGR